MANPQMNEITPAARASLKSRLIVAAILIVLIVPAFFLGSWVFFGIAAIFLVLAITEMIRATGKAYPWYIYVMTYLIVISYVYWFVIKGNFHEYIRNRQAGIHYTFSLENYFATLDVSILGVAVSIFAYCLVGILNKNFTWEDVAYFITFTLILGLGFQAVFFCRYYPFYLIGSEPFASNFVENGLKGNELIQSNLFKYFSSSSLLFYVILVTSVNDAGAYFIGSLFGKHKMNERISPHKTWEGFFGGWISGAVAGIVFAFVFAAVGLPLLPTLTLSQWYWLVGLSLTIPLISDLGDMSFSMIKRHYGIKDYGNVLKGHGGIVDRIGSDLFTCIFTAAVLILITNQWDFFAYVK